MTNNTVRVPSPVIWLRDIGAADEPTVGGKAANLGELLRAGFPVPDGFVITADAFLQTMDDAGERVRLADDVRHADADDPDALARLSTRLGLAVHAIGLPERLHHEITAAYLDLAPPAGSPTAFSVAVRSSATGEDSAERSFAGMNRSYLDVNGPEEVARRVVDCWTSAFSPRSLAYRARAHVEAEPGVSVVVQVMVPAQCAGVAFSLDPVSHDANHLVIEAALGLGESVVGGTVEPDTYIVDRTQAAVIDVRVGRTPPAAAAGQAPTLVADRPVTRVLSDDRVLEIARLVERVEAHFGRPQDVEFAIDASGNVHLVQSRPITTLGEPDREAPIAAAPSGDNAPAPRLRGPNGETRLRGLGASPGTATGPVRILAGPDDADLLEPGEILVAVATAPDWVPALMLAAAVVTDSGGMTCHAAIVSRELGVPAVVGTGNATTVLHAGDVVTIDGTLGTVTDATDAGPVEAPRPPR